MTAGECGLCLEILKILFFAVTIATFVYLEVLAFKLLSLPTFFPILVLDMFIKNASFLALKYLPSPGLLPFHL